MDEVITTALGRTTEITEKIFGRTFFTLRAYAAENIEIPALSYTEADNSTLIRKQYICII